jgi:NADPH:quinone reductase-like Zn-dependent oxidoreductase
MGNLREYGEIVRLLGQGHLRPTVDSAYHLVDGVRAIERLQQGRQMGKIVVEMETGT